MCGLVGIVGLIEPKYDPIFKDLMMFMSVRGTDSSGVGAVPINLDTNEIKIVRAMGGPWILLDLKSFDKLMQGWYSVLLGHCRSSTFGGTTLKNAHPFYHAGEYSNGILGMHNGTLEYSAKNRLKDGTIWNTDSEAIIHNIAHEGPEKTINKLDGAYALAWYDKKQSTVSMIRNDKRPLAFCLSPDKKTLFFCSEGPLLRAALLRNGIKCDALFGLKEDLLLTWKIPKNGKEFEQPLETKLEGWKHQYPLTTWTGNNNKTNQDGRQTPREIKSKFSGGSSSIVPFEIGNGKGEVRRIGSPQSGFPTSNRKTRPETYTGTPHSAFQGINLNGTFAGLGNFGSVEINDKRVAVFRDGKRNLWILYRWSNELKEWMREYHKFAPLELNCSWLDINANHAFKHEGKKKRKQIYFKGWERELLTKEQAIYFFSKGCMTCSRIPLWGNEVQWMNCNHDFLCEFCSLDYDLVKTYKIA